MTEELTLSDKRSIPHWLTELDGEVRDLKKGAEDNVASDRELEKRVSQLEFKIKVMMTVFGGAWALLLVILPLIWPS